MNRKFRNQENKYVHMYVYVCMRSFKIKRINFNCNYYHFKNFIKPLVSTSDAVTKSIFATKQSDATLPVVFVM